MFKVLIYSFILLLLGLQSLAQLGKPIVTNYKNNHFQINFAVYDIQQDKDGIMYFITSKGLISYDGSTWDKISEASNTPFFNMLIRKNRIYLSGEHQFGYVVKRGHQYNYVSISDSFPKFFQKKPSTHLILQGKKGVYFLGNQLVIDSDDDGIKVLDLPAPVSCATMFRGKLLIYCPNQGFYELQHDQEWILNSHLAETQDPIRNMTSFEGHLVLILQSGRIVLYDASFQEVQNINTHLPHIHKAQLLHDDYIALATDQGVYMYHWMSGELEMTINEQSSLESNKALTLYNDVQDNLWIGTNEGVSKAEVFLPFSFYSEESHLPGSINDIYIHNKDMFVASHFGLYKKINNDSTGRHPLFQKMSAGFMMINDLEWVDSYLLMSSQNEVFYLNSNDSIQKIDVFNQGTVHLQKVNSRDFLVYSIDGIKYFRRCIDVECELYPWFSKNITNMSIDDLVLYDSLRACFLHHQKLFWINLETGKVHDANLGRMKKIYLLDKTLLAQTDKGLVKVSMEKGKPVLTPYFFIDDGPEFSKYETSYLVKTSANYYLIYSSYKNPPLAFYNSVRSNSRHFIPMSLFRRLPSLYINNLIVDPQNSGHFWICTETGLVQFTGYTESNESPSFTTVISDFLVKNQAVLNTGHQQIAYENNTVTFQFSSTNYVVEELNEFSYILDGSDDAVWSNWSPENKVTFASLPAGDYIFRVKSKNLYHQESLPISVSFSIKSPWYQTSWMFLVYVILSFIAIYFFIIFYTNRLKKSNLKLQRIVDERTDEIRKQKEEIEEKNKNITSSIEYARTIQDAILTSKEYLQNVLKHFFVFYMPRDIIGGDFYWAYKSLTTDRVVVAVADCTGHGVPGALMSMIGYSLLNEIVIENKVEETNVVLDQLRNGIINSFQQTNISKVERSHDGMDISLVCLDFKTKTMYYSCAKQLILVVRDSQVIELETDFQPISNFISNLQPYQAHEFKLMPNDMIYMFTDGFSDQFGGEKGKKFMHKQFKQLLLDIYKQPPLIQENLIQKAYTEWKGKHEQVDDICVLGIKIE